MEPAAQPNTVVPTGVNNMNEEPLHLNQNGKSKKWMWISLVVILVVAAAAAGYLYMNQQKQTAKETQEASAVLEKFKALEKEVNTLDGGNLEEEFVVVDTDLQSL